MQFLSSLLHLRAQLNAPCTSLICLVRHLALRTVTNIAHIVPERQDKKYIYKSLENDQLHVQVHCPLSGKRTRYCKNAHHCMMSAIVDRNECIERSANRQFFEDNKRIHHFPHISIPMSQFNSSDQFDAITCETRTSFQ